MNAKGLFASNANVLKDCSDNAAVAQKPRENGRIVYNNFVHTDS